MFPGISDDEFWPKVDETIAKFHKDSNTDEELDLCFNAIYEDDKAKYRDPVHTDYKTVDVDTIPAWQVMLRKHAKNIQPVPKQAGPAPKKRKIGEVDNNDSAEED
ncbi:hypothetical protein B0H10DRAFT_1948243 [Mycena sp. CBHHK59/15]|nr:hypothetical protein B0H10DRAFT_1948243 [Mycena sp. CBHHK59/15]